VQRWFATIRGWLPRAWRARLSLVQLQAIAESFPRALYERTEQHQAVIRQLILDDFDSGRYGTLDDDAIEAPDAPLATPSAVSQPRPLFSDDDLHTLVKGIAQTSYLAILLLSRDLALASFDPRADHSALIAEIHRRANALRQFVDIRPRLLKSEPRIGRWWDETQQGIILQAIKVSEEVVQRIKSGTLPRRSEQDILLDFVHILPTMFGAAQAAPDNIVEFSSRQGIAYYVLVATRIAKETFPEGADPVFELVHDPEGTDSWITLQIRVPKDDAAARYKRWVSAVVQAIPREHRDQIRLRCDVR
jgi:hypothetical protein